MKSNHALLLTTLLVTTTASVRAQQTPAASPKAAASVAAAASPAPTAAASPAAATASPAAKGAAGASPTAKTSGAAAASPAAAPTPQVIIVTTPAAPAPPPSNNWGAGVLGLAILGVGGYYGLRYARGRGVTVADSLKKLGVEMPQDAVGSGPQSIAHLRPAPATVVLPPLTSLSSLPPPDTASAVGVPVAAAAGGKPRLVGVAGPVVGQSFALAENPGPFTMGREPDNALALENETTISRRHARIEPAPTGAGFAIVDEGSSNGTFVNGQRLKVGEPRPLNGGDEVQIGAARLRFEG